MTYVVTDLGPIDRHPPGTDVTELYPAETMSRLVKEGYVTVVEPEDTEVDDGD